MLISKRSRRKSKLFASRFRDGTGGNFPLRQYLRCREDLFSGSIHFGLLLVFIIAMVIFGRSVDRLFAEHGQDLAGWIRWGCLALVGLAALALVRRAVLRFRDLRETREEMRRLREEMQRRPEDDRETSIEVQE